MMEKLKGLGLYGNHEAKRAYKIHREHAKKGEYAHPGRRHYKFHEEEYINQAVIDAQKEGLTIDNEAYTGQKTSKTIEVRERALNKDREPIKQAMAQRAVNQALLRSEGFQSLDHGQEREVQYLTKGPEPETIYATYGQKPEFRAALDKSSFSTQPNSGRVNNK